MILNDKMIMHYLAGNDFIQYKDEWYFTSSQIAKQQNKNIFSVPLLERGTENKVRHILDKFRMMSSQFVPLNADLLKLLFPNFEEILYHLQVDLIIGLPGVYDVVTQINENGVPIILLDLVNITQHTGHRGLEWILHEGLSREFCHLLIYDMFPNLLEIEHDYRAQLDRGTFMTGFSSMFSYEGVDVTAIQWKTIWLKEQRKKSQEIMRNALNATEYADQKKYLTEAFSGMYCEKFANICGMMYFAEQWEVNGVKGLKQVLSEGWSAFASKTVEENSSL